MSRCSNTDQGNRSSEEKIFEVADGGKTRGKLRVAETKTDAQESGGSTLADESMVDDSHACKGHWEASTLPSPSMIANENPKLEDLLAWKEFPHTRQIGNWGDEMDLLDVTPDENSVSKLKNQNKVG